MPVAERVRDDRRGRAQRALTRSHVYDIRRLAVDRHDGNVVISGSVSSFYFKQLAQELVLAEVGNTDQVRNEVEVD
jgi:hypothetical protein